MTLPVPESQQQYGSILTVLGENAEQNGKLLNKQLEITHMAIGDANDQYVQPDRKQTALVNELARIEVNSVDVTQSTPDSVPTLTVEAILPDEVNDIVIREFAAVATFDGNTYFHAVGNCARIYVPPPVNNGNVKLPVTLEMIFVVTSVDPVVQIDPTVVTASREYVQKWNSRNDVKWYGVIYDSDSDSKSGIEKACSEHDTIVISGPTLIKSKTTIPENVTVVFTDDGVIISESDAQFAVNGEIEAPLRKIFTKVGDQFSPFVSGNPKTTQWPVDWFGVTPDINTDWRAVGLMNAVFLFSSRTKTEIVFRRGLYNSAIDNYYSDVTARFQAGAVFTGTVHAAINTDYSKPDLERPKNINFYGQVTSLERVGTYNCDTIHIDRIWQKSDPDNHPKGWVGGGVHFYDSTKDLDVDEIIVDDSQRSYGLGIDAANNLPERVRIKRVIIKDSKMHGCHVRGRHCHVDEVIVLGYGRGAIDDKDVNYGLPGYDGDHTELRGVLMAGGEHSSIGKAIVLQPDERPDAGEAVVLEEGTNRIRELIVRGGNKEGLVSKDGSNRIDAIDVRLCKRDGVQVLSGTLQSDSIFSGYNGGKGVEALASSIICDEIHAVQNAAEGMTGFGTSLAAGKITVSENGENQDHVLLSACKGTVDHIESIRTEKGKGGGVYLTNGDTGKTLKVGLVSTQNEGLESITRGALTVESAFNIHVDGMNLNGGAFQGLRLVNVGKSSFSDGNISGFDENGIAGNGLKKVGFMNVDNDSGTNINSGSVETFNCSGVTLP